MIRFCMFCKMVINQTTGMGISLSNRSCPYKFNASIDFWHKATSQVDVRAPSIVLNRMLNCYQVPACVILSCFVENELGTTHLNPVLERRAHLPLNNRHSFHSLHPGKISHSYPSHTQQPEFLIQWKHTTVKPYKSHQIPKLKCFSYPLAVVFVQSIEAGF